MRGKAAKEKQFKWVVVFPFSKTLALKIHHIQRKHLNNKSVGRFVKALTLGKTSMEKKSFSFGHCPNHLTLPPWPQFGQLGPLFFYAKNDVLRVWQEKKLMLIMKVAMIIMMIIMTKMTKKTYIYCEVWVKNAILRTITW